MHWVITRQMLERAGYLEEYVKFWSARPEVDRVWVSFYTPQIGEKSPEMLTPADRETLVSGTTVAGGKALSQISFQQGFWTKRSCILLRIPMIACLPKCLPIIRLISKRGSSLVSLEGRPTAPNADAPPAAACIGCAESKSPVL